MRAAPRPHSDEEINSSTPISAKPRGLEKYSFNCRLQKLAVQMLSWVCPGWSPVVSTRSGPLCGKSDSVGRVHNSGDGKKCEQRWPPKIRRRFTSARNRTGDLENETPRDETYFSWLMPGNSKVVMAIKAAGIERARKPARSMDKRPPGAGRPEPGGICRRVAKEFGIHPPELCRFSRRSFLTRRMPAKRRRAPRSTKKTGKGQKREVLASSN